MNYIDYVKTTTVAVESAIGEYAEWVKFSDIIPPPETTWERFMRIGREAIERNGV